MGFCLSLNGQITTKDSIVVLEQGDSLDIENSKVDRPPFFKRIWNAPYPSPGKAALLSAVIPGAGQAYNKDYWKIPVIYGLAGGLVYLLHDNRKNYIEFRDAYKAKVDQDTSTIDIYPNLSASSLENVRNFYDKNLQWTYIGLFALYVLNASEAFVDAHLVSFDVADDLSLHLSPSLQYLGSNKAYGGLSISLRSKSRPERHKEDFAY